MYRVTGAIKALTATTNRSRIARGSEEVIMRYRLQRREKYFMPNILGNCSQPVATYRWKDILASDDKEALEDYMIKDGNHRIIDTREEVDMERR